VIVIRAGALIEGTSDGRENQLIFVRGDRIEKVADGSAAIPADAKVIDLQKPPSARPDQIRTRTFLVGRGPG